MSIATLDRATDKIIYQMAPEELAKYARAMAASQAKRVRSGKITQAEADKQNELFAQKYLTFREAEEHIRYLQALCTKTNKIFLGKHIKNTDTGGVTISLTMADCSKKEEAQ